MAAATAAGAAVSRLGRASRARRRARTSRPTSTTRSRSRVQASYDRRPAARNARSKLLKLDPSYLAQVFHLNQEGSGGWTREPFASLAVVSRHSGGDLSVRYTLGLPHKGSS